MAVVVAFTALAGCAPKPPVAPQTAPESQAPSAQSPIGQMSLAERAAIASGFPVQVPVPAGTLVAGNAQGPDAWDYTLILEQPPAQVATWYQEKMTTANWQLVGSATRGDGGFNLRFAKAQAESRVEVKPEGTGSRVVVSIGLGAPVNQTQ